MANRARNRLNNRCPFIDFINTLLLIISNLRILYKVTLPRLGTPGAFQSHFTQHTRITWYYYSYYQYFSYYNIKYGFIFV